MSELSDKQKLAYINMSKKLIRDNPQITKWTAKITYDYSLERWPGIFDLSRNVYAEINWNHYVNIFHEVYKNYKPELRQEEVIEKDLSNEIPFPQVAIALGGTNSSSLPPVSKQLKPGLKQIAQILRQVAEMIENNET